MGVMEDLQTKASNFAVTVDASNKAIAKEELDALMKSEHGGTTEVSIKTGLSLVRLHAGLYENGAPTNNIINIKQPWETRVHFGLTGPLKEMICGKWCLHVDFESIGTGPEFRLKHPEFYFDCNTCEWCVTIPGYDLDPSYCGTVFNVTVVLQAVSHCGRPLPIVGFVKLGQVLFFEA